MRVLAELRQAAAGANKYSVDVVVALRIGFAVAVSAAAKFLQKLLKACRVADAFGRVQEQIAHEVQEVLRQYEAVLLGLRPVAAVSAAQFSNRVGPIEQAAVLDVLGEVISGFWRSKAAKMPKCKSSNHPRRTGLFRSSSLEGYAVYWLDPAGRLR
jgi:hypothetical protein